jgi:hypothetical protein
MRSTSNPAAGTAMVQHVRTEVMHLVTTDQLRYGDNGTALCGRSTRFMDDTGVRDQNLTLGHPAGHCSECWQHTTSATTTAPAKQITCSWPDAFTQRRYYVDGVEVVTIHRESASVWVCSPNHRSEWRGASELKVGEHVDGCGRVATRAEWAIYLTRVHTTGARYAHNVNDAYAIAEDLINRYYA